MVTSPGLTSSSTPTGFGQTPGVAGAAPGQLTIVPALGAAPTLGSATVGTGLTSITTPAIATAAPEVSSTTGLSSAAVGTPTIIPATTVSALLPVGALPTPGASPFGAAGASPFGAPGTQPIGAPGTQPIGATTTILPGSTLGALTVPSPVTATATTAAAPTTTTGATPQSPVPTPHPASTASSAISPAVVYQATLDPLNASSVHGTVTASFSGNSLAVNVQATGLAPAVVHPQFLQSMADAAANRLPTAADDTNHDGLIDATELTAAVGQPILDLSINPTVTVQGTPLAQSQAVFPTAGADGTLAYHEVFTFNPLQPQSAALEANVASHLANGAVVLEGTTGNNAFVPDLPAAVGLLHVVSGSSTMLG